MRFKKSLKKSSSLVLVLVLVLSTFQFSVFAAGESATSGEWTYYIDETLGGAYITAYSGNASSVTVPSQLGGATVKALGEKVFAKKTNLKNITIPSGIEKIGSYCFLMASGLVSVSLPSTVTSIGGGVFESCTSLKTVSLGNKITSIPPVAFYKCSSLTSVTGIDNVTKIEYNAFDSCTSLSSFAIKSKVTDISYEAFYNCTALKSITFPAETTYIRDSAFENCTSLSSVTINGSNHEFGENAFLNTAAYNNSNNWINGAFVLSGCLLEVNDQNNVEIPEGVKLVPNGVLSGITTKTLTISSTVSNFGNTALQGLSSLEAVTVSSGNAYFSSSDGVLIRKSDSALILYPAKKSDSSYTIPSSVKKIGANAFESNASINTVTLHSALTDIGVSAFNRCSKLSTVNFASGLKTIEDSSFSYCSSIKTISIPDTVTQIGPNAFLGCSSLTEAKIPSKMTEIPLGMFADCKALKKVSLGSSITNISAYAFSNCSSLESNVISSSVKTIGSSAFENCVLIKSVDTKANIGNGAFSYCTGLTTFKMKSGTTLGASAFKGCTSLSTVELPSTLESIGSDCFLNCPSLKKVSVPQSVIQIGSYALGYTSYDSHSTVSGFVIEGYMYSAAQSYANSCGFSFKKLDIESPGSIRKDNIKKIIYLGGLKVTPTHLRDYLKSVGACKTCTITKSNGSVIASGSYVGTGCKITLDGKQFTIVINGETTGDGIVTSSDYLQIKKSFLKVYSFDEYSFIAADVNPNGRIDTTDYLRIKLHFLGQYNLLA